MKRLPLIIGHRGAAAVAPENTMASFERAIADGADGIEFDVRLSRDNVPVCVHDPDLRRTGLRDGLVSDFSSSQLSGLTVGLWFNQKFPALARPEYAGATIPKLYEVFTFFLGRDLTLYVELKCAARESRTLAEKVVDLVRAHNVAQKVVVKSFNLAAIKEVKLMDETLRTAALFDRKITRPFVMKSKLLDMAEECGADEISLHYTLAGSRMVRLAKERGFEVVVWTADNPAWVERARARGVRTVITNNPAPLVRARG